MGKICINNLKLFGYHGCLVEENNLGQWFEIDAEILTDIREAGRTDKLENTVDYREVIKCISTVFAEKKYRLLECLATDIGHRILEIRGITEVSVTIRKPQVPVDAVLDWVSVSETMRKV